MECLLSAEGLVLRQSQLLLQLLQLFLAHTSEIHYLRLFLGREVGLKGLNVFLQFFNLAVSRLCLKVVQVFKTTLALVEVVELETLVLEFQLEDREVFLLLLLDLLQFEGVVGLEGHEFFFLSALLLLEDVDLVLLLRQFLLQHCSSPLILALELEELFLLLGVRLELLLEGLFKLVFLSFEGFFEDIFNVCLFGLDFLYYVFLFASGLFQFY